MPNVSLKNLKLLPEFHHVHYFFNFENGSILFTKKSGRCFEVSTFKLNNHQFCKFYKQLLKVSGLVVRSVKRAPILLHVSMEQDTYLVNFVGVSINLELLSALELVKLRLNKVHN
jgi:hypothetical protein